MVFQFGIISAVLLVVDLTLKLLQLVFWLHSSMGVWLIGREWPELAWFKLVIGDYQTRAG